MVCDTHIISMSYTVTYRQTEGHYVIDISKITINLNYRHRFDRFGNGRGLEGRREPQDI